MAALTSSASKNVSPGLLGFRQATQLRVSLGYSGDCSLRLHSAGDVNIGAVFQERPSAFNIMPNGVGRSIVAVGHNMFGATVVAAEDAAAACAIYDALERFESLKDVPENVRLAFRSFTGIYDRDFGKAGSDSRRRYRTRGIGWFDR